MTDPDVVQDLDAWIALYPHANIAQRARDEIVRLREKVSRSMAVAPLEEYAARVHNAARAEALEEAASICEQIGAQGFPQAGLCVAAIRALAAPPESSAQGK